MDAGQFSEIVQRAEADPQFLHSLLFSPETVDDDVRSQLGRKHLGAIFSKSPAEVVARAVGIDQYCGNTCTSSCDNTCGGSCGYTTNIVDIVANNMVTYFSRVNETVAACGNTCTSSCDNTCGGSCGHTTNLTDFGQRFNQPQVFR